MTADMINHPPHYTRHPSGVECIQITRHMGFNLGNAVKYIWRADLKGAAVEDLEKAAWYIRDEIAKRKAASTLPNEGLPFAAHMARRDAERAQWHKSAEAAGLPERSCDCAVKAGTCHCPGNWTTDAKAEAVLAELQRLGQEFDTDPQPLEWPDTNPVHAEIGPGGATLTKRQCDCGETAGECFCPWEWPAAPIGSPPEGLGEASSTHAAKSAEGHSAARVWHGQDGGVE